MAIARNPRIRRCLKRRTSLHRRVSDHQIDSRLKELGYAALEVMYRDEDWNSNTLRDLANVALDLDLAELDDELRFVAKEVP